MSCDDKLRPTGDELVHRSEQTQLSGGRRRSLGFFEEVQAVAPKAVEDERQKRLSVGLFVRGSATAMLLSDALLLSR